MKKKREKLVYESLENKRNKCFIKKKKKTESVMISQLLNVKLNVSKNMLNTITLKRDF